MVRFDRRNKMACFVRSQFLTCGRYVDEFVDEFDDDRAAAKRVSATARGKTSPRVTFCSSPFELEPGSEPSENSAKESNKPPAVFSTALRPSLARYPRKWRMSLVFFSRPTGGGAEAENDTQAAVPSTPFEFGSGFEPDPRRARSRYSSLSPAASFVFSRGGWRREGDPDPDPEKFVSPPNAPWLILVASLNTTPNVPSDSRYPKPYLLV